MDSLRGQFPATDTGGGHAAGADFDLHDDAARHEPPPSIIGQDERRMQVRAYNFWASLLDGRNLPSIEDLDPETLPDFGPYSVLLDFTCGIEDPSIQFLGERLAEECGTEGPIENLADVPGRSLLSRITDHYMQILANQAPIGFEAEFVNTRGATILYRGILLPFSSDDDTIDFVYGVINWKELADQRTADELLLEIDQALEPQTKIARDDGPMTEWADGPADGGTVLDLATAGAGAELLPELPAPAFGVEAGTTQENTPDKQAETDGGPESLADLLASARTLAQSARGADDRSRQALYAAISRAYDFLLEAEGRPEDFAVLLADAGIATRDHAPFTPIVKLVFGADYDKTRLAEFAAVLAHGRRNAIAPGMLAEWIGQATGGLKGVVQAERRLRRGENPKPAPRKAPRATLARKLRKLGHRPLAEVAADGDEFTLLVARRLPDGEVVLLGEVTDDVPLLEKAARKLVA
ncbi:MAG: hypothetical protein M0R03_01855 [Novosphingobium sp.]|nr:hypothetical protein [Novosphingobium sp.]